MRKMILGKKISMSTIWQTDGRAVPVTAIQAGPCQVTQIRTKEKDGYQAVQIGFGQRKKANKPLKGHLKDLPSFRYLREFRVEEIKDLQRGAMLSVEQFNPGDKVDAIGVSKGLGFQGVVRRHHFHGHPTTHGTKDSVRMPGSIGAGGMQHVRKGTRMAGRMGGAQITVKNLKIVEVDKEKGILYLKGAVPGKRNALVMINA